MVGKSVEQLPNPAAARALTQAIEALQMGRHDSRLAEGAQANALESIAWSLIGILSEKTGNAEPSTAADAKRSLTEDFRRGGLWQIDPHQR